MKKLFLLLLTLTSLHASIFSSDEKMQSNKNKEIHTTFRENVSRANDIIKRGEYEKISSYRSELTVMLKKVDTLDIESSEKELLRTDIQDYAELINSVADKLQKKAPQLNQHYHDTLNGLGRFNKKIASIGLSELTQQWRELSKIKNRFVRKPNKKLEKKFHNTWNGVVVTITELYLDEEMEEPLFEYLDNYKSYFEEIAQAYSKVKYSNINKIKPLSYKIKAKLELYVPYES